MKSIRIGSGAGYGGDRLEPALELIEKGDLDYIGFECLAERTVALGQAEKLKDPSRGYNALLEYRMERVLPLCHKHKVKLITNMGAANPVSGAEVCVEIAKRLGLKNMKIACVTGDDILPVLDKYMDAEVWETHQPLKKLPGKIVSANAYMGMDGIVKALKMGADVIITGRVADPALFAAPVIHEFGWSMEDWDRLGKATMLGHLLECGSQTMGGYYAEPGKKDVPGIGHIGFPIAEINEAGDFTISKLEEAGGLVSPGTCAEQICYEIHDPSRYLTPDVVADFSNVSFVTEKPDVVRASGASGNPRPETLKCSVGYQDCFIGEGEISYGGPGCVARAHLALAILKERIALTAPDVFEELKFDIIGCNSLYRNPDKTTDSAPEEVRVRLAGRAADQKNAEIIGNEVEALYTNGPAGGCGATKRVREIVSVASILISRYEVTPSVKLFRV